LAVKAQSPDQVLYLFSSNSRPLYEQDVLNLLAAPIGYAYSFRYRRRWVAENLRPDWEANSLVGRRVLVHFSLQQPNQYLPTVLVPFRVGTVARTSVDAGDILMIQFSVGSDVVLTMPPAGSPDEHRSVASAVSTYANELILAGIQAPPNAWASRGADLSQDSGSSLSIAANEGAAFAQTVRILGGTSTYRDARFYRISGVSRGGTEPQKPDFVTYDPAEGYRLTSRETYQLGVLQSQAVENAPVAGFTIDVTESVGRVVGPSRFEISSLYDVIPVSLMSADVGAEVNRRSGVIEITPEDSVKGPRLTLRANVGIDRGKKAVAAGAGVAATAAAIFAAAIGNFNPIAVALLLFSAWLWMWLTVRLGGSLPIKP
jgi:hypothetical protein